MKTKWGEDWKEEDQKNPGQIKSGQVETGQICRGHKLGKTEVLKWNVQKEINAMKNIQMCGIRENEL